MKVEQKLKALQEMVDELDIDLLDDSIVKSNKLPFLYEEQLYRVIMPTQKDLTIAKAVADTLKVKLLVNENNITKKSLIKVLKEKQDIDIEAMKAQQEVYGNNIKDLYISLVSAGKSEIEGIKAKIAVEKQNHMELSIEISGHLSVSIESQVETEYIRCLTSLCTEKNIDEDKWIKAWSTSEYEDDNTNLPDTANLCFSRLFLTLRN